MTIHNLYIFDRSGRCLFYSEWHRRRGPGIQEEEFKLMFGMLFSLRSCGQMSPTDIVSRRDGFVSFHTSRYRLHYLETPSGLRLALNTDLGASAREALQHIYGNLFVELVVKNPLCPPRAPVQSLLFRQRLDAFVRSLPYFGPRGANS
ncbi:LOW QUALITY PROTEIN: trafficking protein particle complex subunit 1 [Ammospiza maritima maritima]